MRKADVQVRNGSPAVNVKVYGCLSHKLFERVEKDTGLEGFAEYAGKCYEHGTWATESRCKPATPNWRSNTTY